MAKTLTVNVRVDRVRPTLAAFRALPKDASHELRERTLAISRALAVKVQAAARAEGGQAALMAPTVKAQRDRVPVITAGGTRRVGRHRVPAWRLLFASEFGMDRRSGWFAAARYDGAAATQYKPHAGRGSYWFFRTVQASEGDIGRQWHSVAGDVLARWGGR